MKKILLSLLAIGLLSLSSSAQCTIDAGYNRSVCGFPGTNIPLQATSTISTNIWTSSGTGTFVDPNNLNTSYIPSAADISAGGLITLTITGNDGSCGSPSSSLSLSLLPVPTINAGTDIAVCTSAGFVALNPTASDGANVFWASSGTGQFHLDAQTLISYYIPTAADISAGTVTLSTYATNMYACTSTTDDVVITFVSHPIIDAFPTQSICGNSVQLNATYSGAGGILWTSEGTGTFSNPNIVNPIYTPSQEERLAGNAILMATTTDNGVCDAYADITTVRIDARIGLLIGPDQTVCLNAPIFPTVLINAGTVLWTSSGTGTFTNATSLTPVYTPSAADYVAGEVNLTATSSTNGACPSESGTLKVTFVEATTAITVNAGADIATCKPSIALKGTVTNATGGTWTSNGTGTFSPVAPYLNTSYIFSNADVISGSVTFTLTTTGTCGTSVSDQIVVTIPSSFTPIVNAGPDQYITGTSVSLSGSVSGTSSAIWNSNGTGTFSSATSLSATYTPSSADILNGLVKLTLTSTGNGSCDAASDDMYVILGNTFTISGVVETNTGTLDQGIVLIFKKENTSLNLIRSTDISAIDAGAYTVNNIPGGNYIVCVIPTGSIFGSTFLPTYAVSTQKWDQAKVLAVASDQTQNISLTSYTSAYPNWNTGNDVISGVVYTNGSTQALLRTSTTENLVPAPNTIVYLTNTNGDNIAYTLTDSQGRYVFTDVLAGKYRVVPEFGGTAIIGTQGYREIITDGNSSTVEDGSMIIEERASATTGIMHAKALSLNIYPNPTTTTVSFNLVNSNGTGTIKLLNQAGVVQLQQQVDLGISTVTLNIEKIPAGMYILQVTLADEVYSSKIIKY